MEVFLLDGSLRILHANRVARNALGPDVVLETPFKLPGVAPSSDQAVRFERALKDVLRGRFKRHRFSYPRAGKTNAGWYEARVQPLGGIGSALLVTFDDISSQIDAEVALAQREQHYLTLLQMAPDFILVVDAEGHVEYINQVAEGWDIDGVIGTVVFDYLTPDTSDALARGVRLALETGETQTVDTKTEEESGHVRYYTNRMNRLDMGAEQVLIMSRDVTDQRQAETALRRAYDDIRSAQRIAGIGSWTWDVPTDRIQLSTLATGILGLDERPDGHPFEEVLALVPPSDVARLRAVVAATTPENRNFAEEFRVRRRDDRTRHLHVRFEVTLSPKGLPVQAHGTVQDVTDRREQEQRDRRHARHMERLSSTATGFLELGVDDDIYEFIADGLAQITDGSIPFLIFEVEGDTANVRSVRPPEGHIAVAMCSSTMDIGGIREPLCSGRLEAIPGGDVPFHIEQPGRDRPDQEHAAQIQVAGIMARHDLLGGVVMLRPPDAKQIDTALILAFLNQSAVALDQRRAYAMLRDTEARLRQSQKMDAIGQLAGSVAHDFNNLLTGIISFAGILRDAMPGMDPRAKDVRQILAAADRAAALTRRLLSFSRQQPVHLRPTDVNSTLENIEGLLQRAVGEAVELELDLETEPAIVLADATEIDQVLLNLSVNARDAMPDGGRLAIRANVREFSEDSLPPELSPGRYVQIRVRDTGTGMPAEVRARIFEPFFTTKNPEKGTGLGLATCYGILRQWGGAITVESTLGQGTEFRLLIPVCHEVPAEIVPLEVSGEDLARARGTILVVEDEPIVRAAAQRGLETAGFEVICARDAQEARSLFERHRGTIDLVFSDVVLPHGSGHQLACDLRGAHPSLPVLLTSGYMDERVSPGVLGSEFELLRKPYDSASMISAIRRVLGTGTESSDQQSAGGHILLVDDDDISNEAIARLLTTYGYSVVATKSAPEARAILESKGTFDAILCDLHLGSDSGLDFVQWVRESHAALGNRVLIVTGGGVGSELENVDSLPPVILKPLQPTVLLEQVKQIMDASASVN